MLSKAELEVLTEKYEAKAERAYQNYQETGISRYDRERRNAEELADAMRMAAQASDDYSQLINLRHSKRLIPRMFRSFIASRMWPISSRIAGKYRSVTEMATISFWGICICLNPTIRYRRGVHFNISDPVIKQGSIRRV